MISTENIDAALAAHSAWKKRLLESIEMGKSEFKVDVVRKDNACQFGQWLYSIPQEERNNRELSNIINLHAEFHKTASAILELALNGKKEEALKRLEHGGDYGRITGKLVLALNNLKNAV
jgi:hypothetical protein